MVHAGFYVADRMDVEQKTVLRASLPQKNDFCKSSVILTALLLDLKPCQALSTKNDRQVSALATGTLRLSRWLIGFHFIPL